jgi:hypothetical protein
VGAGAGAPQAASRTASARPAATRNGTGGGTD